MNSYNTSTPSAAFGIAAVAMTAITIGLTVIAPAKLNPVTAHVRALEAPSTEVAINPSHIDVIAVRETVPSTVKDPDVQPKRKQPV